MWRDNTVEKYLCTFLEVNYIYLHTHAQDFYGPVEMGECIYMLTWQEDWFVVFHFKKNHNMYPEILQRFY